MGTVIAKEMGLPISKILCGVNDNAEFSEFLKSGTYTKKPTIQSPSSAMNVSNPVILRVWWTFTAGMFLTNAIKTAV